MKITVVGTGAWGTALALCLHQNGHRIRLWGHDRLQLNELRIRQENARHLPGVKLPGEWEYDEVLPSAIADAEALLLAVPSHAFVLTTRQIARFGGTVISVTKGIELGTGLTMCGVLAREIPGARTATLSGPSLAVEVARGVPTAVVAAADSKMLAHEVQKCFHSPALRVYASTDLLGVELGGALKNVMAIAAGIADGLGFGDNAKAALITRSLAEMRRLGVAAGAQSETFSGLSGMGDLTVTCFSRHSRNRAFGEKLGRGTPVAELTASSTLVEGFPTTRSAHRMARTLGVITPVIDAVHSILYEERNPSSAVRDLLSRESKVED